jgi:hypothetical protein
MWAGPLLRMIDKEPEAFLFVDDDDDGQYGGIIDYVTKTLRSNAYKVPVYDGKSNDKEMLEVYKLAIRLERMRK